MIRLVLYHLAPILFPWALMLLPLSLYLLFLGGYVNRRAHPMLVRGDRSFLGVVFALSGFLLIGPPSWVADPFRAWGPYVYPIAYTCYLLLAGSLLWSYLRFQAQQTIIYNLDPDALPVVVRSALDELGLPFQATAGRIAVDEGQVVLEVEASAAWFTATLTWLGSNRDLRTKIEDRIKHQLTSVTTTANPCRLLLVLWGAALLLFALVGVLDGLWFLSLQG